VHLLCGTGEYHSHHKFIEAIVEVEEHNHDCEN